MTCDDKTKENITKIKNKFVNSNHPALAIASSKQVTCTKALLFRVNSKSNFITFALQLLLPSTNRWRCS